MTLLLLDAGRGFVVCARTLVACESCARCVSLSRASCAGCSYVAHCLLRVSLQARSTHVFCCTCLVSMLCVCVACSPSSTTHHLTLSHFHNHLRHRLLDGTGRGLSPPLSSRRCAGPAIFSSFSPKIPTRARGSDDGRPLPSALGAPSVASFVA